MAPALVPLPAGTTIRGALLQDIPQIRAISAYYVQKTVLTFHTEVRSEADFLAELEEHNANGLPYLVVVAKKSAPAARKAANGDSSSGHHLPPRSATPRESAVACSSSSGSPISEEEEEGDTSQDTVLGYATVSPYRAPRAAYAHTGELTIFLERSHTRRSLGSHLLARMFGELIRGGRIQQLVAMVAIDATDSKDDGSGGGGGGGAGGAERLRRWYRANGFREVGVLEKVGKKFGAWVDVRIFQVEVARSDAAAAAAAAENKRVEDVGAVMRGPLVQRPQQQQRRKSSGLGVHRRWSYSIS